MWRINRRDRRQDENGPDDDDVQMTPPAPEPSPEPMAPVIPADSPKSAPSPESSPSPESPDSPGLPASPDSACEPDPTAVAIDVLGRPPLRGFGRIPVHNVRPEVESGQLPIYSVVDEEFEVTANVFREGHDAVGASVILTDPDGNRHVTDMHQVDPWGLDIWLSLIHI